MYEDIKEQFKSVIINSQNIPEPKIDNLFARWEIQKKRFIDRFGGLIYEWPEIVEFALDDKIKHSKAMEFAQVVYDNFNNADLADFIDANIDTFFENRVSKNLDKKKIPEGMKLVKAFKYFETNKTTLRCIQDMASQIIQEDKIKGTLCFSVHPLDFLSSSENTYNWRSCHALDGEFRAGNLSYMVDDSTFMVYIKGADNQRLYGFKDIPWNSKKWRMLIHASGNDKIIFAGRQYPFSSKSGIDTVLNIYNNLMTSEIGYNYWSCRKYGPWKNDYVDSYTPVDSKEPYDLINLDTRYLIYENKLVDIEDVVKDGSSYALNYNDVLRSTCYKYPYYAILNPYSYKNSVDYLINHPAKVGREVYCLHCGKDIITNPEIMRCDDCELEFGIEDNDIYNTCDCCGARIFVDDSIGVGDEGEIVCESCYDNYCFVCDDCGCVYYNEEKVYIPGTDYYPEEGIWVCKQCYEDRQ